MIDIVRAARLIFWDFDGVIKESVDVKTRAYFQLFEPFGAVVAERVREHHEAFGGMSRFEKFPLYLQWAGEEPTENRVREYCEQFSHRVVQGVIDAPWVPGVERYLRNNSSRQIFVLVSATPQDELLHILDALNLTHCFAELYGAPARKQDAIRTSLGVRRLDASDCLMIGDAQTDLDAASINRVPFLLRKHESNRQLFSACISNSIDDFTEL